jgi:hypothetical protein
MALQGLGLLRMNGTLQRPLCTVRFKRLWSFDKPVYFVDMLIIDNTSLNSSSNAKATKVLPHWYAQLPTLCAAESHANRIDFPEGNQLLTIV